MQMLIIKELNFEGIAIGSQISLEQRQEDITEVIHNIMLENERASYIRLKFWKQYLSLFPFSPLKT